MLSQYDNRTILAQLEGVKVIAVIGLSPKEVRPSYQVAKRLQTFSYTIAPVRPGVTEVLGEKAYKKLEDIPFKVDLVNVFSASKFVADIVEQCIQLGINKIWLQEGIYDSDAQFKAQSAGISMIMNQCIYKQIVRLGINQNNNI